jgi:hypothetical protein
MGLLELKRTGLIMLANEGFCHGKISILAMYLHSDSTCLTSMLMMAYLQACDSTQTAKAKAHCKLSDCENR